MVRNVRQFVLATGLILSAGLCSPALAQKNTPADLRSAKSYLTPTHLVNGAPHVLVAKAELAPTLISHSDLNNKEAVATSALQYFTNVAAPMLNVPERAQLIPVNTTSVGSLWDATYRIEYNGIPVRERVAHLTIGAINGKPMMVRSTLPTVEPLTSAPSISSATASATALGAMPQGTVVSGEPTLVYVHDLTSNNLALAYEVMVKQGDITTTRFTVDAISGRIIEQKELLEYIGTGEHETPQAAMTVHGKVTAMVHPASPRDTMIVVPLPSETLTIGGKTVTTDKNGEFTVDGITAPYTVTATFKGPNGKIVRMDNGTNASFSLTSSEAELNINWADDNSDVAERNAFWAVNAVHDYVRRVDTALVHLDKVITVNVNRTDATCNAYFSPQDLSLNFLYQSGSCANTALIPDVIYHEFGHRVNQVRYTDATGNSIVDGSLDEGFADLNSAFMRDNAIIGKDFTGANTYLRNLSNTNSWPKDLNIDIHATGLIVAGAIWDLRKTIGHDAAEHLFHMMSHLAPDGTNTITPMGMHDAFMNVLYALIATDDDDNDLSNGTPHINEIIAAFHKHNINLSDEMALTLEQVPDQPVSAETYDVHLAVNYVPTYGELNDQSVKLYYSVNNSSTYTPLAMVKESANHFVAHLPKQPMGTVVKYYAGAALAIQKEGEMNEPRLENAYSFIVGGNRIFFDDAEKDNGWTIQGSGTGAWVRDVPSGSELFNGEMMQQDTDHTATGTACYVTGNANAASNTRYYGIDPVSSSQQTLVSPVIDLSNSSNPIIRTWYYYFTNSPVATSNTTNSFQVMISSNGGTTWKTALSVTRSYISRWLPIVLRVKDYVTPTNNMKVKFVVTNRTTILMYGQQVAAASEAGIDDFEVIDAPTQVVDYVAENTAVPTSLSLGEPFPNPSRESVTIPFHMNKDGLAVLEIKNVLGETVATPLSEAVRAGNYSIPVHLSASLPEGIYWAQLRTEWGSAYKKLIVGR